MSSLRQDEPVGIGLRRIACASIEQAIRCLTRQPGQVGDAVGKVRAAEAMLDLLEPDLPRAIARRDRAIMVRLTQGLEQMTQPERLLALLDSRHKKSPSDAELASAVKSLRKQWSGQSTPGLALSSKAGNFNPAIYRLVADMAELRGHAGTWPVDELPNDVPPRGLRRTYTRARKLAGQPTTAGSLDELLVCLDKLSDQLSVLSKPAPPIIKAQRKLITRAIEGFEQLYHEDQLNHAIQKQLGSRASSRAKDINALSEEAASNLTQALAETPTAFINRISVYWSVWKRS